MPRRRTRASGQGIGGCGLNVVRVNTSLVLTDQEQEQFDRRIKDIRAGIGVRRENKLGTKQFREWAKGRKEKWHNETKEL